MTPTELYNKFSGHTPTIFQQELIEDRVKDAELWQEALTFWFGNGYRPQSVFKMLTYYDELLEMKMTGVNANAKPIATHRQARTDEAIQSIQRSEAIKERVRQRDAERTAGVSGQNLLDSREIVRDVGTEPN